jgi:hypothetical protein
MSSPSVTLRFCFNDGSAVAPVRACIQRQSTGKIAIQWFSFVSPYQPKAIATADDPGGHARGTGFVELLEALDPGTQLQPAMPSMDGWNVVSIRLTGRQCS